ncbi:toll-like receptor 4 [Physella acuta]|uniref:toll-like receptor 4 n=1 Tax=Physella acuta TaxID=109671 RepID=UPI0027DB4562|nr:toll-like receptor 4 [Physella acuta]
MLSVMVWASVAAAGLLASRCHGNGALDEPDLAGPLSHQTQPEHRAASDLTLTSETLTVCDYNSTYVNCCCRGLQHLPRENYPATVVVFDLKANAISTLAPAYFSRYTELQVLDLSMNRLTQICPLCFVGLGRLQLLNLWGNNITISSSTIDVQTFRPLSSLRELVINRNNVNVTDSRLHYPDQALSVLGNLTTLHIDGIKDKDFGPGFGHLTSLVKLNLQGYNGGYCMIESLRNSTFRYLTSLQVLDLQDCQLFGDKIEAGAFLPLTSIVSINLTHNEGIGLQYLDNVFYGLQHHRHLREMRLQLIVDRYSFANCMDSDVIKYFPRYLQVLDFQENSVEGVDRSFIARLPASLRELDVSGNKFVIDLYLKDLKLMKNLTVLKLNGGTKVYKLPKRFPYFQQHYRSNCSQESGVSVEPFVLNLPPNVKVIEMTQAGLSNVVSGFNVTENTLENLSISHNHFPRLEGPLEGLTQLKFLDLASCDVEFVSESFFSSMARLEVLKLESNYLGDYLDNLNTTQVFSSLQSLRVLNLSLNDLHHLPDNIFTHLVSLEYLDLSSNPLTQFTVDISHLGRLKFLNLYRARIFNIPPPAMDHIDSLVKKNLGTRVNMAATPIKCDCENFPFLKWMTQSKAFDKTLTRYYCFYPDASLRLISDGYNTTLSILNRECVSNIVLLFIVSCLCILTFIVISCGVVYRFRWNIRYFYYAAYLYYMKSSTASPLEYKYDVFVSYSSSDEDFVFNVFSPELEARGLKLCIHGRDFTAGDYIASNIVRAVCSSRRTVVILTQHMIDSYWCQYEVKMANMESAHKGRNVLVFLFLENIPESRLGVELLYHIRSNTYMSYPDPKAINTSRFWDKLTTDIKL